MEDFQSWKFFLFIIISLLSCFLSLFVMIFLTAKKTRTRQHKKGVIYFSFILGLSVIASVLPFVEVENKYIKNFLDNGLIAFPLLLIPFYSLAFNYTFKKSKPGKSHRKSKGKMTAINQ